MVKARKFIKGLNKNIMMAGFGASCGVIFPMAIKQYFSGPIPFISDYLGNWGNYETFLPISVGAVSTLLYLGGVIDNPAALTFGLASLSFGILNGIFVPSASFRARGTRMPVRAPIRTAAMVRPPVRTKATSQIPRGGRPQRSAQSVAAKYTTGPQDTRGFQESKTGFADRKPIYA